ncbi:MAG: hypothetical protein PVJ20_09465, partial [Desulfobacterales bacterium]
MHKVRQHIEAPEYRPSGELPPTVTSQTLEYEYITSCAIGSSPFKNQVLVRFSHIFYIRQGI